MRRLLLVVLVVFALWLSVAIVVGLYFAADGGHGGKVSVILVSVAFGAVVLALDGMLIRRLWNAERRRGEHSDACASVPLAGHSAARRARPASGTRGGWA